MAETPAPLALWPRLIGVAREKYARFQSPSHQSPHPSALWPKLVSIIADGHRPYVRSSSTLRMSLIALLAKSYVRCVQAAHGLSGLGVRSEQYICGCVRCDAESRRAATARSGIIGLTIRDSSRCHRMAVGIRRMRGRLSAAKPCACSAAKCVRLRRRGCDAFVLFAHPAWACRVSPVAIRWLGSDLRRDKARGHRRRC